MFGFVKWFVVRCVLAVASCLYVLCFMRVVGCSVLSSVVRCCLFFGGWCLLTDVCYLLWWCVCFLRDVSCLVVVVCCLLLFVVGWSLSLCVVCCPLLLFCC